MISRFDGLILVWLLLFGWKLNHRSLVLAKEAYTNAEISLLPFCRKGHVALGASYFSRHNGSNLELDTDKILIFGGYVVNYDNPRQEVGRDLWSLDLKNVIEHIEAGTLSTNSESNEIWTMLHRYNIKKETEEHPDLMNDWPSQRWMAACDASPDSKYLVVTGGEKVKRRREILSDMWLLSIADEVVKDSHWIQAYPTPSYNNLYENSTRNPILGRRGHKIVHVPGSSEMILAGGEEEISVGNYACTTRAYTVQFETTTNSRTGQTEIKESLKRNLALDLPGPCRNEYSLVLMERTLVYFGGRIVTFENRNLIRGSCSNELWTLDIRVTPDGYIEVPSNNRWVLFGTNLEQERTNGDDTNWPAAREMHRAAFSQQIGSMFLFGGKDEMGYPLSDLWEFSLTKGWSRLPTDDKEMTSPRARYMHSLTIWHDSNHGDRLVVFGGQRDNHWLRYDQSPTVKRAPPPNLFSMINDVWIYNPRTATWTIVNSGGCHAGDRGLVHSPHLDVAAVVLLIGILLAWFGGIGLYSYAFNNEYEPVPEMELVMSSERTSTTRDVARKFMR
jgi:hypothetical protein